MNPAQAIQIALLLPLAPAALAPLRRRWPRLITASGPLVAALITAVLASQLSGLRGGARATLNLVQPLPGIWLGFRIEPFGLLFALIIAVLWIPAAVYSAGYLRARDARGTTRFLCCQALAVSAALGAALSRNLLTLFLFLQLLTLATYPLVARAGSGFSVRCARLFFGTLAASGLLLLLALAWTFHLCGTLEFRPGGILAGRVDATEANSLLVLFAFGLSQSGLILGQRWLLPAMEARTPLCGFPIAAVLAQAGVFSLVKVVVSVFGAELLAQTGIALWLCWAAAVEVLLGAGQALRSRDLKPLIAWASLAQLGGVALGTLSVPAAAAAGGGLHLAAHASGVLVLFLATGSIELRTRSTNIAELVGLGRSMPITYAAFALGALLLAVVAPFGAWRGWSAALGPGAEPALLLGVLALGALATATALLAVPVRAFLGRVRDAERPAAPRHDRALEAAPILELSPCAAILAGAALCFLAARLSGLLGAAA